MDAASNNSVENIRAIRQEVMYATTNVKYKIYIIDEAHMLSTSAFNALLKTLEEPPKNVIFILATTEEHKLLPTILSRCMRFEFKKISIEDVVKRIKYILEDSKIEYENEALNYVARICDGGMRDALSILERCIDDQNSKITLESVQNIVGASDRAELEKLAQDILDHNVFAANEKINKVLDTGKDARYITSELTEMFMEKLLKEESSNTPKYSYIIKELSKLDAGLRQAINVNILFKAKIMELCTKITYNSEDELVDKIEKLELRIKELEEKGVTYVAAPVRSQEVSKKEVESVKKEVEPKAEEKPKQPLSKGAFKDFDKLRNMVMEKDNLQLYSALTGVKAETEDNAVVFNTENEFAYTILNKVENAEMLRKLTQEIINDDSYAVKIEYKNTNNVNENKFETYMSNSNIPFTNID